MCLGKKESVTFAPECTSTLMTRSSCIDCQGVFHILRPEDLRRTLRFFGVPSAKLKENTFWHT